MSDEPEWDGGDEKLPLYGVTVCLAFYSFNVGGSEKLCIRLAKHYAEAGAKVICCGTRLGEGPLTSNLVELGISYLALDIDEQSRLNRYVSRLWLARWLRQQKIDVLHVHHFCVLNDVFWAAKYAGVTSIIVTEHTADVVRNDRKYRRVVKSLAPRVDEVTAINSDIANAIAEVADMNETDVTVIENGIDTNRFVPRQQGIKGSRASIIWVGRLHADKDIFTALQAVKRIYDDGIRNVSFSIVGDGEEAIDARAFVAKNGLESYVRFIGEVNDVVSYMQSADIMLISSLREGTPLALLEAMGCGLAVVATSVGGIPSVVSDRNGLLVPPAEPNLMATALKKVIQDRSLRDSFGLSSRRIAEDLYSETEMLSKYVKLISNVSFKS